MGKIFISYARADDEPFVKQLYQESDRARIRYLVGQVSNGKPRSYFLAG